jgi:hypothetical protein
MNDKEFERLYIIVFVVGFAITLYDIFFWRP